MSVLFIGKLVPRWHCGKQSFGSIQARAEESCQHAKPGARPKNRL
ncbi:MAG: hypothetical protein N838_33800 [Thiohalocapsa sp. PB-PSB1]|nr:MAG: hypothetical protein N838_33800 [Thiohalocapsa sp. PB-PSB1]